MSATPPATPTPETTPAIPATPATPSTPSTPSPEASAASGDGAGDARFRVGIAGYDLWPHAVAFCRSLKDADFCRISDVWDEDPRKLARLVELTGATGHAALDAFCASGAQ